MRVHINQVCEGCIISKEVYSISHRPLIRKSTVLNQDLLQILRAFLIDEVEVEPFLNNGTAFKPAGASLVSRARSADNDSAAEIRQNTEFSVMYLQAVQAYKKLYLDWQSGALVDISKIRSLLIPAVENGLNQPDEIFKTYHYSKTDEYLYHHSVSVALLSAYLGKRLGFSHGDTIQLAMTGLLCDCGMTKLDQGFVSKKIALTDKEYKEIKQHPVYSYKMLKNIVSLKEAVKVGVLQHHERLDGSGYPLGVKTDQLHPFGKIAALADTYQAMISERPYRNRQSPFKVLEQLMQDEFGKFDLTALNELKKGLLKFSSGTNVRLSDGRKAEIVFVEDQYPTRPLIKVDETSEIVALKDHRHLFIDEII
ncbi:HD-GYP domain-containing protein [Metabacillus idriensis]|uniref:HD-GYP domain-containing protein n=1 Tax=Metabacillus idriensis TaxID=324768 RepID=UPI00174BDF11|nr:HD-GYP domain-containing protein [Metabacillus idriensis]